MAMTAAPNTSSSSSASSNNINSNNNNNNNSSSTSDKPPRSITTLQQSLWSKVITRRRNQLSKLNSSELDSIIQIILPHYNKNNNNSAADKEQEEGGEGEEEEKKEEKSQRKIEETLRFHFYNSVDNRESRETRVKGLDQVRAILSCIDDHWKLHCEKKGGGNKNRKSARGGGGRKQSREEEKEEQQQQQQERESATAAATPPPQDLNRPTTAQTSSTAAATAQNNQTMGQTLSSISSSSTATKTTSKNNPPQQQQQQQNQNNTLEDSDSDIEIIEILTPPSSPKSSSASSSSSTQQQQQPNKTSAAIKAESSSSATSFTYPPKPPPRPPILHPQTLLRTITFAADSSTPSYSASLSPRSACNVSYDAGNHPRNSSTLASQQLYDFHKRLWQWDPYWHVVYDWSLRTDSDGYKAGYRTSKVKSCSSLSYGQAPTSSVSITLPSITDAHLQRKLNAQVQWGTTRPPALSRIYRDGEKRLILRSLPLYRKEYEKKKRADTHLWPKGTFVQLDNVMPLVVAQRKQQSHDPTLWKGMCHVLDLTPCFGNLTSNNAFSGSREHKIDVCTREIVLENDEKGCGMYGMQVAVCEYIGPDRLYDLLLRKKDGVVDDAYGNGDGEKVVVVPPLEIWSFEDSLKVALKYLNKQTVVIDDSDDDDDEEDAAQASNNNNKNDDAAAAAGGGNSLTFSLICGFSMKAIETPVRGRKCKHMQCFDLRNFLHSNSTVSGGRWRCCVCEEYVSLCDLVCCGLFSKMLEDYRKDVSGSRDKVQFAADGSYRLMDVNKLRHQKKRPGGGSRGGVGEDGDGGGMGMDNNVQGDNAKRGRKNDEEIILL